jgi:Flp pilus assembly protein TadD
MKIKKIAIVFSVLCIMLGGWYIGYAKSLADHVNAYSELTDSKMISQRLAINPNDPEAVAGQAHKLLGDNKYEDAIPAFRKLIQLRPSDDSAKVTLGLILIQAKHQGGRDEAIKLFREVSAGNSESASEAKKRLIELGVK